MRFLFIVQGEGRGHLTQALALSEMLSRNGHQVLEVLVGHSDMRKIPDFFFDRVEAQVQTYPSPNFLKTDDNKHFRIFRSITYNLKRERRNAYLASIRFIRDRVNEIKPDFVINFYELLCGLAYRYYGIRTPLICVAHQFIFEHSTYTFSRRLNVVHRLLRLYTRLSSLNARKRLALSPYPKDDDPEKKIFVVPPLLRREIFELRPMEKPYLLGYILNHGFSEEIIHWHNAHTETTIHVFWDKPGAPEIYEPHGNLTFHRLNDKLFTRMLADCTAFFGTAGFESVSEALYFGKTVLLVPAHAEQELNVDDAQHTGLVLTARSFDELEYLLKKDLLCLRNNFYKFKTWVDCTEELFLKQIVNLE